MQRLGLPLSSTRTAASRILRSSSAFGTRSPIARRCSTHVVAQTQKDEVLRTLSYNGQVSVLVATTNALVQEACTRHQTAPTASAALGRALTGSLLMACFREEGEKTQVTFKGDGPLGGIQVIADATGVAKGKVGNPACDPPLRPDGKLNVGAAVGKGVLAIVRSLPYTSKGFETPYTGMVPIHSGEVAEDLARYLVDSEQVQSALGLGVSVGRDLSIKAAGGFMIQVLPFAEDETIDQLEKNIMALGSLTSVLHDGATAREITDRLLDGLGSGDEGFSLTPKYGPCDSEDLKGRMKAAVATLGEKEVKSILEEQGHVEVSCEFCKETYRFDEEDVMAAVAESKGGRTSSSSSS